MRFLYALEFATGAFLVVFMSLGEPPRIRPQAMER